VQPAAFGFRSHSGWAVLVAVTKSGVIARRRIEIADPAIPGSKQPFHAAEGLPFDQAEALIRKCQARSTVLAAAEVHAAIAQLDRKVERAAILCASGRPLPDLAAILRSHALIHTAEGEFYREILALGCEQCGLSVTKIRERDLPERQFITDWGRSLGPPWRKDHKLSALAAWLTLTSP
jgi:hypothetical protein